MAAAAKPSRTTVLQIDKVQGRSQERSLAEVGLDPAAHAAATVKLFTKGTFGELSITDGYEAMRERIGKVRDGSMAEPEAMLVAQSAALNAIFTELARRSAANMGEYIKASESYMRLALKAQAQCRATIETLAAIKNPPVVFARQANIAAGPQQVNNHPSPSRADEPFSSPNKLLEDEHGKRLDDGAAGATVPGDPALEAVGAINRTGHRRRKAAGKSERLQGRQTGCTAERVSPLASYAGGLGV